jgi:transposase InsO family protein
MGVGFYICADLARLCLWRFRIGVFARRIVIWRVSASARTDFVLDALGHALHARCPTNDKRLIHHFDRRLQSMPDRQLQQGILYQPQIAPEQHTNGAQLEYLRGVGEVL